VVEERGQCEGVESVEEESESVEWWEVQRGRVEREVRRIEGGKRRDGDEGSPRESRGGKEGSEKSTSPERRKERGGGGHTQEEEEESPSV